MGNPFLFLSGQEKYITVFLFLLFIILVFTPSAVPGILPYPLLALLSFLSIILSLLLVVWLFKYTDKQIDALRGRITKNK